LGGKQLAARCAVLGVCDKLGVSTRLAAVVEDVVQAGFKLAAVHVRCVDSGKAPAMTIVTNGFAGQR
jgi:hypothetical protein